MHTFLLVRITWQSLAHSVLLLNFLAADCRIFQEDGLHIRRKSLAYEGYKDSETLGSAAIKTYFRH